MDVFVVSLVMVFLAEMGDKTQLVALTLAGRYNPWVVLAGIAVATGVSHVLSVALGGVAGHFLSGPWVTYLAGVSFVIFGLWTLRGDSDDDDGIRKSATPFLAVFWTFLIAEMGDKTMLTTATLTAQTMQATAGLTLQKIMHFFPVWLGSTLGMVLADGIAIAIGAWAGTRLPEKPVRWVCASVFLLFGAWSAWQGVVKLPTWSWAVGAGILVVGMLALFRPFQRAAPDEI